jgi:two-component system phosphate regulon sensor histidine kinase PhoR
MSRAIFRTSLIVCLLVLIFTAGVFFVLRRSQAEDETYAALRQEAFYAEQGLLRNGEEYLRDLGSINRVTWISPDGEVMFDSEFPDETNQLSRPEVRAALDTGEGQGIRRSTRSGVQTMYVARLCADGTVLRLSRPLSAVRTAIASIRPALWVVVLALLLSLLSAFRASKQIIRPINEMDLDHEDAAAPYPELTPLLERIQEQKRTIAQQNAERETLRREFTANVSHELKTPLTSISGFAELMAQGGVPPEKVQEFSGDIYRESQRLIDLVNDIIHLSRLDEEGFEPERETVDLYDLAADTIDSLREAAARRNVSFRLEGGHVCVQGVWRLLGEIVYNLCDNAVKYNHYGGSVEVTVSAINGAAVLSVADTGIGIPYEHQSRVFERFYRVDKSHSKAIGGTGLGLSIVKHGAQFHHAEIQLESEPGSGTKITLIFPKE